MCVVPTAARKAPKERNVGVNDEWKDFKAMSSVTLISSRPMYVQNISLT